MKILLSTIIFLIPVSILAELICPSLIGCRIVITSGECIGCVQKESRKITEEIIVPNKKVTQVSVTTPSSYYEFGYPTQPETNLLTSSIHHFQTKKVKSLVLKRGSIDREFALCRSGCSSSRAATMNYPHNGKLWRHKPSLHKLRQMTKKDWGRDKKLYDLVMRER